MTRKQRTSYSNSEPLIPADSYRPNDLASQKKSTEPQPDPTYEQISERAYEIFLARGGEHGHDEEDWYQAERELRLGRH